MVMAKTRVAIGVILTNSISIEYSVYHNFYQSSLPYPTGATGTFRLNPSSREMNVSVRSMPFIF